MYLAIAFVYISKQLSSAASFQTLLQFPQLFFSSPGEE